MQSASTVLAEKCCNASSKSVKSESSASLTTEASTTVGHVEDTHHLREPRIALAEQIYNDVCINEYAFHLNFSVRYS